MSAQHSYLRRSRAGFLTCKRGRCLQLNKPWDYLFRLTWTAPETSTPRCGRTRKSQIHTGSPDNDFTARRDVVEDEATRPSSPFNVDALWLIGDPSPSFDAGGTSESATAGSNVAMEFEYGDHIRGVGRPICPHFTTSTVSLPLHLPGNTPTFLSLIDLYHLGVL